MPTVKIELLRGVVRDGRVAPPGTILDVEPGLAGQLIEGQAARLVEPAAAPTPTPAPETATSSAAEEAETSTPRRGRGRRARG